MEMGKRKKPGPRATSNGVKRSGKKWMARIGIDGESVYLGTFETRESAVKFRRGVELEFHRKTYR